MIQLNGKTVVVVGLGRSGVAATELCVKAGAEKIIATDKAPRKKMSQRALALEDLGVELRLGGHDGVDWDSANLVVVSPGVPTLREVVRLRDRGVQVTGELDLATRAVDAPIAVVGGTNGKSTVTSLVGEMLAAEGNMTFFMGGNLGTPLAERAGEAFDWVLLEVSSFQAEHVPTLHPRVAALLNISDDHLDRYPSARAYADAKGNVFERQTAEDIAVIPARDSACRAQAERGHGRLWEYGPGGAVHMTDGDVMRTQWGARFDLSKMRLQGQHNRVNAMAAATIAHGMGLSDASIRHALLNFEGLPHRTALVGELGGVRFYDDSKGTNVGATVAALRGMREQRAVLIAGGRDKQGSYAPLAEALRLRGRAVVLIGEAAERIAQQIGNAVPIIRASDMDEAVLKAYAAAHPGDAVLLSPACSSFDMFPNYKVRGQRFEEATRRLIASEDANSPQEAP